MGVYIRFPSSLIYRIGFVFPKKKHEKIFRIKRRRRRRKKMKRKNVNLYGYLFQFKSLRSFSMLNREKKKEKKIGWIGVVRLKCTFSIDDSPLSCPCYTRQFLMWCCDLVLIFSFISISIVSKMCFIVSDKVWTNWTNDKKIHECISSYKIQLLQLH